LFVSGDYTSATDNLTIEVAECLLLKAFEYLDVPTHIKRFALRSLRVDILDSQGNMWDHKRGQLMGSLLSFPLLCLQNYCAFRWFVSREEVSDNLVRINGDDIVFHCRTKTVCQQWMTGVGELGLELSPGKTFVHRNFFSLNSTYFWFSPGSRSRILSLPVVRFGLLKLCRGGEVGKNFNSFVRPVVGQFRWGAIQTFYRRHRKVFRNGRVSLCRQFPEGLGMKILSSELRALKLLGKELEWFNRKDSGVPLVPKLNNFEVSPDYKFKYVEHQLDEADRREQIELFIDWHWSTDLKIGDSKERDFRYTSNFESRVMYADPYEEVLQEFPRESELGRLVTVKNSDRVGFSWTVGHLMSEGDRYISKTMLRQEHARICDQIDKEALSENDSTVRRERILVRKNILKDALERSVNFSGIEALDLAVDSGRIEVQKGTLCSFRLGDKVAFDSDGAEESHDVSQLLVNAYRWKWGGSEVGDDDGESGH